LSNEQLAEVADLATRQLNIEHEIESLESALEAKKESLNQIQQSLLPEAMLALGMQSFKLNDGTCVLVEKFYSAKIPDEMQSAAFKWLRDNGHGSLIKRNITCKFGKGEDEVAERIKSLLIKSNVVPEDKTSVHPQTLKAFVREQSEDGKPLPTDLLGVYIGNRSKVTPAK